MTSSSGEISPAPTRTLSAMVEALRDERYMALETRKRDGSWVSTPVNLDGEEDHRVASSINRKYPLLQGIAVRYTHMVMRYQTQHYVVVGLQPC